MFLNLHSIFHINLFMSPEKSRKIFLIIAIALIAFNLRPSISAVGPLIYEIRTDTGLSNTLLGMLTTLPILAFGAISVLTPLFTRRIGTEGTMALALIILTAGILLRIIPASLALFAGTLILGVGIALGNVLLPGIVKKSFPERSGMVTGIYSATLGLGAALASGVSVPLSEEAGLGWRGSLGVWAVVSALALIVWLPQLKRNFPVIAKRSLLNSLNELRKSTLAWHISLFMGIQSFTFYIVIAWLPEILQGRGIDSTEAGWLLALCQGMGVIGTLIIPNWASRLQTQRLPVIILVVLEVISIVGLMIPGITLVGLWVSLLGFSMGSCFGLALLFIVLRTRDTQSANELSGVSQSVGYTLAATGPALFGAIFDLTASWTLPLGFLLLFSVLKLWTGWRAGTGSYV